jgi:dTDP-4-dehydrorhamnose reductase
VDVDAVRVPHQENSGLKVLLQELTERYRIPVAITEIQLNCHREQQLRWFKQIIDTCADVNNASPKIIAVTAWSLMGAFGWNKLVTVPQGDYECGVFDLSSGEPRPTALYHLSRNYTGRKEKDYCIAKEPGWWQVSSRYLCQSEITEPPYIYSESNSSKPVLIIGKTGTLGSAYARICETRGLNHRLLSRHDIDITNKEQIEQAINRYKPWAIVNAAGYVRVDDAENDCERCFRENAYGPESLAMACAKHGIKFMTFSSDLVFNGSKKDPYVENDQVHPLNVYGRSKVIAERLVMASNPDALVIRTSAFFGPWDKYNFVYNVLQSLKAQQTFVAANDVNISPTYIPDLVHCSLDLMVDDERDIWHLANTGDITWSDLAREVAMRKKYDHHLIDSRSINSLNLRAPRPGYSVLNSNKGITLPSLENALERYFIHNEFYRD